MEGELKTLVRLLGIDPKEVTIPFKKGKPIFSLNFYEMKDSLEGFFHLTEKHLSTMQDEMRLSLVAKSYDRFAHDFISSLQDWHSRSRN